ncbi:uncharacterized protein BO80DRAFT_193577 [Aspergillus ibericus CBS 121593]|uniref:Uncharacterized protein n=1 Tax=Aspergillus ibericus CBS 121593 TaxID=1448316 RepID=A0A395GP42_9EURO|nr:hypothetical protein BO80DRAFT_193577 [Aspergillus ibericus CBS 121593]RAK97271.1 hypothetical protein BO80DRAFT_193577 [Aspergillus ibericus CBS 121593]
MRLLNSATFRLRDFPNHGEIPEYAIFSHTWLQVSEGTELVFEDLPSSLEISVREQQVEGYKYMFPKAYQGFRKAWLCCQQALRDGIPWVWIDTCCIDKRSTVELSEAINSMFRWYKNARRCYVYLADLDVTAEGVTVEQLKSCRWFERGWTLQELLAPSEVLFFEKNWIFLGYKSTMDSIISDRTGIDSAILRGWRRLTDASVAERMSWASGRKTTREEDIAYCLMGIFDVNMPLLYGEGEKAFIRLQEEIIRNSDDQSLFAWSLTQGGSSWQNVPCGLLASHPSSFANAGDIVPMTDHDSSTPYTFTNCGLNISLILRPFSDDGLYHGLLNCRFRNQDGDQQLALRLKSRGTALKRKQFYRVCPAEVDCVPQSSSADSEDNVYIIKQGIVVPNNSFSVVWNVSTRFSVAVRPSNSYNSKRKLLTLPDDTRNNRAAIIVRDRLSEGTGTSVKGFAIVVGFNEHYPACVCLPMNSSDDWTRLCMEAQFSRGSSQFVMADGTKFVTDLVNGDQINRITISELVTTPSGVQLPIMENHPAYVGGAMNSSVLSPDVISTQQHTEHDFHGPSTRSHPPINYGPPRALSHAGCTTQ